MADFNALQALINAYIKKNGVQAITGQILNGILNGMVTALGKGYTIAGSADPTTDPGTMTGPLAYIAYTAGTYTNFGGLEVEQGEVAMLIYNEDLWHKEVLFSLAAAASVDANVGTPSVDVSFVDGLLTFDFHNMKGNPGVDGEDGDAAGFGTVNATVDSNVGTPGVTVQSSGPNTAKNFTFQFTNLKGETGVTSVVATVDNTSGNPQCAVSLNGQQLTLAFTGLKGAQGDTGSSVDYPFTIVNNLTTNDATQALSAAMGVQLESEVSQLEAKVGEISIPFVNGMSVALGGTIGATLTLTPQVENAYRYAIVNCKKGDVFTLTGKGGASTRLWGFVDANNVLLAVSSANLQATDLKLIAPENAAKFVMNSSISASLFYYSCTSVDYRMAAMKAELDGKIDVIDTELEMSKKYIDISTRQQRLVGYATKTGTFTGIGTAGQSFLYVPVESGKAYRFTGTYKVVAGYADLIFYTGIPQNNDVGVVLDADKANGTSFDVHFIAPSNGYVFLWSSNKTNLYDAFFLEEDDSVIDALEKTDKEIKEAINYTAESVPVISFTSLKGYVTAAGTFDQIGVPSYTITMKYFPVSAGTPYRFVGTHRNINDYGSIVFSESVPVTGDFGIIIKASVSGASFDVQYTPDLDGYVFLDVATVAVTKTIPEQKMLLKESVFGDCLVKEIKLVDVAYQGKYISTSTNKIVDTATNGCFVVPVVEGERIFIRAKVVAFGSYAVVGFSEGLTEGDDATVLLSVPSGPIDYSYENEFVAPKNGYLLAWSTHSEYGSSFYVEMFQIKERQKELFDRYLPETLKIQTFGDSITDNYWGDMSSWVSYIPDNIKNTELTIVNSAVGGAGIGGNGEYNLPHQVMNGYTRTGGTVAPPLDSTSDIVVILCGTNDYAAGQTMSSVTGNLATSLQYIFEHSKAKVLFCTPLQRYNTTDQGFNTDENGVPVNSNGMTLRDVCDELVKVCRRFSVPVLDLNADANINRYNIFDYSLDGLHPHRWGDAYVSRLICEKIKAMMRYDLQ